MPALDANEPYFWIRLRCDDDGLPRLLDLYTFFYDFNRVYELSRIATDPNYEEMQVDDLPGWREGPVPVLRDRDRLRVEFLRKESPLEFAVVVAAVPAAIGAIWGVVQIVEKLVNFRLNRRKLQEEIRKLERENGSWSPAELPESDPHSATVLYQNRRLLNERLRDRDVGRFYDHAGERLLRANVQIVEVEIEVRRQEGHTRAIALDE